LIKFKYKFNHCSNLFSFNFIQVQGCVHLKQSIVDHVDGSSGKCTIKLRVLQLRKFAPFLLWPNESRLVFDLSLKNATADLQLSGFVLLRTNVSDVRFEVLAYNGRISPVSGHFVPYTILYKWLSVFWKGKTKQEKVKRAPLTLQKIVTEISWPVECNV
jgi:hypothetical protein